MFLKQLLKMWSELNKNKMELSTRVLNLRMEQFIGDNTITEGIELEQEQDFETEEGDNIILDGTEIATPPPRFIYHTVKVIRNATDTANIYEIDGVAQPTLVFTEGDTHYFDLSHSSLYNADQTKAHIFRLSTTSGGTHGSGSEYTTGVTKSASYILTGQTGAFLQIVVASGTAPDPLFYYCTNHSGMGGRIETREVVSFVRDENSNLRLNGSDGTIFGIQLEDFLGFIMEERQSLEPHIILEDNQLSGNFSILLEDDNQLLKEEMIQ